MLTHNGNQALPSANIQFAITFKRAILIRTFSNGCSTFNKLFTVSNYEMLCFP